MLYVECWYKFESQASAVLIFYLNLQPVLYTIGEFETGLSDDYSGIRYTINLSI